MSPDRITRLLSARDFDSKQLWLLVKPVVRQSERDDGVIIFDDTIEEKPYTKESDLICWHHDPSKNRSIKGIKLLNGLYQVAEVTLPMGFDLVRKPVRFCDIATTKENRKGTVTTNELPRRHLETCQRNHLKYRDVLTDSGFSSQENMTFIRKDLDRHFIMALKSNRTVALSEEDRKPGRFTRIDSLEWTEHTPVRGWIKSVDFPVLLHRQVFTNQDGSIGTLYLECSDLDGDATAIEAIYQQRWTVEVFHKTFKSNTALAKSPTKCVRTQGNHVFMSIYAAFQLECLSLKLRLNHVALRGRLYVRALQPAMDELNALKGA